MQFTLFCNQKGKIILKKEKAIACCKRNGLNNYCSKFMIANKDQALLEQLMKQTI